MIPFDKIKTAPIPKTDIPSLYGKIVSRSITVESSNPWLIEDIKKFIQYRLTFKYYCKLTKSKPNLKSYIKFINQKLKH